MSAAGKKIERQPKRLVRMPPSGGPRAERERPIAGIVEFGQQRHHQRHDAGGRRALHDADRNEHGEVRRGRAHDAADAVHGDDDAINVTAAEAITEPITERQQRRERDRLRGDEQRCIGDRNVQVVGDVGDRHVEDRAAQNRHEGSGDDRDGRDRAPGATPGLR